MIYIFKIYRLLVGKVMIESNISSKSKCTTNRWGFCFDFFKQNQLFLKHSVWMIVVYCLRLMFKLILLRHRMGHLPSFRFNKTISELWEKEYSGGEWAKIWSHTPPNLITLILYWFIPTFVILFFARLIELRCLSPEKPRGNSVKLLLDKFTSLNSNTLVDKFTSLLN